MAILEEKTDAEISRLDGDAAANSVSRPVRGNTNMSKDKKKVIWFSKPENVPGANKRFVSDLQLNDPESFHEVGTASGKAIPLPAHRYPKNMFVENEGYRYKELPDIFSAGNFWMVSAKMAEIMSQFNLGQNGLHPVQMFQYDRETPIEGDFFLLAFGESRDFFVPGESPGADEALSVADDKTSLGYWNLRGGVKDGEISVKAEALLDVDLWRDPKLSGVFFLSNALVTALKASKLTRRLALRRCNIID